MMFPLMAVNKKMKKNYSVLEKKEPYTYNSYVIPMYAAVDKKKINLSFNEAQESISGEVFMKNGDH